MRRGTAAEIARVAAEALIRLPGDRVTEGVRLLLLAHPSMGPIWRLGSAVLAASNAASGAREFVSLFEADPHAVDAMRTALPETILTISHSSSVVELVRRARPLRVLCMRSDPGGEGVRMAKAISTWTEAALLDDDVAVQDVPAQAIVVGADAVTPRGVINKVKTAALAKAARSKGVPSYAIAGETKFVGADLPATGSFEATPLELFTAIAAPAGLLSPHQARDHAWSRPLHPQLRPFLAETKARSA
jgi:initiation factor 2B subunit 1/2 family protein